MIQNKVATELSKKQCCAMRSGNIPIRIKIIGVINSVAFQKARLYAEKLCQHLPLKFEASQITEMFQIDWQEYIQKLRRHHGGKTWSLMRSVGVFINDVFIGDDIEFLHYINETYVFSMPAGLGNCKCLITEQCKRFMEKSKRKYVFFTFTVDGWIVGTFVFMLYSDLLPLTCQHFLNLCTGSNADGNNVQPYYINKYVHRIVKNGWLQCGGGPSSENDDDTENTDSETDTEIPDESYCIPHDRRGVLSMANNGKHSNGVQFVVSLKPNPWMNYYYVAFGQLIDGAKTLQALESIATYYENPNKQIVITDCGEYLFETGPQLETESRVPLKHVAQSSEEEEMEFHDDSFHTYSVTPCLSDHMPEEMSICVNKEICPPSLSMKCNCADISSIRKLLINFQPDIMTEEEKLRSVSEISNIILSYVFNLENNEYCLKHISLDTQDIIHKILETAHKIAVGEISKVERDSRTFDVCIDARTNNCCEIGKFKNTKSCLSLLQGIINEAILFLINSGNKQE